MHTTVMGAHKETVDHGPCLSTNLYVFAPYCFTQNQKIYQSFFKSEN